MEGTQRRGALAGWATFSSSSSVSFLTGGGFLFSRGLFASHCDWSSMRVDLSMKQEHMRGRNHGYVRYGIVLLLGTAFCCSAQAQSVAASRQRAPELRGPDTLGRGGLLPARRCAVLLAPACPLACQLHQLQRHGPRGGAVGRRRALLLRGRLLHLRLQRGLCLCHLLLHLRHLGLLRHLHHLLDLLLDLLDDLLLDLLDDLLLLLGARGLGLLAGLLGSLLVEHEEDAHHVHLGGVAEAHDQGAVHVLARPVKALPVGVQHPPVGHGDHVVHNSHKDSVSKHHLRGKLARGEAVADCAQAAPTLRERHDGAHGGDLAHGVAGSVVRVPFENRPGGDEGGSVVDEVDRLQVTEQQLPGVEHDHAEGAPVGALEVLLLKITRVCGQDLVPVPVGGEEEHERDLQGDPDNVSSLGRTLVGGQTVNNEALPELVTKGLEHERTDEEREPVLNDPDWVLLRAGPPVPVPHASVETGNEDVHGPENRNLGARVELKRLSELQPGQSLQPRHQRAGPGLGDDATCGKMHQVDRHEHARGEGERVRLEHVLQHVQHFLVVVALFCYSFLRYLFCSSLPFFSLAPIKYRNC
eukprot:Hpha_TRINITY_DN15296_c3_g10::TRINITY_DN15296_c3_g10_i1::g.66254::m.66254